MSGTEIIDLWQQGLSKFKLAEIYRRRYNDNVRIIRMYPKSRHERYITPYEALSKVEHAIYNYIMNYRNK